MKDNQTTPPANFEPLTEEETQSHFEKLWAGDPLARDQIIHGNMHWIRRAVDEMDNQSTIPAEAFLAAGRKGLTAAVDAFSDPKHRFSPNDHLQGCYAGWWVMLQFSKLAHAHGYACNHAG
ncbi:hypothetical protein [Aeoliella sp.]|uniref:hypothetical protein n=1 Tax=Aeoliella sp. TaxID=2795800 RepID=UPI003CCBB706